MVFTSLLGELASRAVWCNFWATNNEDEYKALIAELTLTLDQWAQNLDVFNDLQVIINQMQGDYQAQDPKMTQYLNTTKKLLENFESCKILQIRREENSHAHALANLWSALKTKDHFIVPLLVLLWSATMRDQLDSEVATLENNPNWMTHIIIYLRDNMLHANYSECRKIKQQDARYCLVQNLLYRISFFVPFLKCVTHEDARMVLMEFVKENVDLIQEYWTWYYKL